MTRRVDDGFAFVAVSYGEGSETTNFEQSDHFWLFYMLNGKINKKELLSLCPRNNEERLAAIKGSVIDVVICRNFGPKSMASLREKNIALYAFDGGCSAAVEALVRGELREL